MAKSKPWADRINDAMEDAFFDAFNNGDDPKAVLTSFDLNDGSTIEVELMKDNSVNVIIYHAGEDNERECPNIVAFIEDNLNNWQDFMDAYNEADVLVDMDYWFE